MQIYNAIDERRKATFSVVLSLAATASSMVIDSSLFVFFSSVFSVHSSSASARACFCWLFVIVAVRVCRGGVINNKCITNL